ncbi:hypothetical protein [Empedobacter falsenii]|uniref:hypothetical protein n=1 Tax=Empedobacter falsenii TaxID=343874 RepID=UPI003A80D93B
MKKSILIKSEEDFNKVKNLLGERLYLDFHPAFLREFTAIVVYDDLSPENYNYYGVGSIGCAKSQQEDGFVILDTNLNIINEI